MPDFLKEFILPFPIDDAHVSTVPLENNVPVTPITSLHNDCSTDIPTSINDPVVESSDGASADFSIDENLRDETSVDMPIVTGRSTRSRNPPTYLKDFHCNLLKQQPFTNSSSFPLAKYISYHVFSSSHRNFLLNVSMAYEPSFYHQAAKFPQWQRAMTEELEAMERTQTWFVVSVPEKQHTI